MNKEKFNIKCSELIEFENKILKIAKQNLEYAHSQLARQNLVLDIRLFWHYYGEESTLHNERIDFKLDYMCTLSIQIRKMDDAADDLDLIAITFCQFISYIVKSFFTAGMVFGKCSNRRLNKLLKSVNNTIEEVLNIGYEKVLNGLK